MKWKENCIDISSNKLVKFPDYYGNFQKGNVVFYSPQKQWFLAHENLTVSFWPRTLPDLNAIARWLDILDKFVLENLNKIKIYYYSGTSSQRKLCFWSLGKPTSYKAMMLVYWNRMETKVMWMLLIQIVSWKIVTGTNEKTK